MLPHHLLVVHLVFLQMPIYAAYMGTDMPAGGFGRILGDKISDAFGLPMMQAGEKPLAEPKPVSTDADIKKLNEKMEKKLEEDPEFAERVGKNLPLLLNLNPNPNPNLQRHQKQNQFNRSIFGPNLSPHLLPKVVNLTCLRDWYTLELEEKVYLVCFVSPEV